MAKKKIKIDLLNSNSIQEAIKYLKQYRDELPKKCEEICKRLSEVGIQAATTAVSETPVGKVVTIKTDIKPSDAGCEAALIATGKTVKSESGKEFNLLLAVEFGAGIKYNPEANPKASDFGMGVGTYPGQTHAFDKNGWYYLGDDGEWHKSYGVKATMPMYKASVAIRDKVNEIVKDVFK